MNSHRRVAARFNIKLPLLLFPLNTTVPLVAETRDISTNGFFCTLEEPLGIGQRLRCLLLFPELKVNHEATCGMCIEAEAEVVRIVADQSQHLFGLGCRILSFRTTSATAWKRESLHLMKKSVSGPQ